MDLKSRSRPHPQAHIERPTAEPSPRHPRRKDDLMLTWHSCQRYVNDHTLFNSILVWPPPHQDQFHWGVVWQLEDMSAFSPFLTFLLCFTPLFFVWRKKLLNGRGFGKFSPLFCSLPQEMRGENSCGAHEFLVCGVRFQLVLYLSCSEIWHDIWLIW